MGAIIRLNKMPENCSSCPFSYDEVRCCKLREARIIAGKTRKRRMPLCPLQNEGEYISKIIKSIHCIKIKNRSERK